MQRSVAVRGAVPSKKLDEFRAFALKSDGKKESQQWYARHLMWHYASEMVPGLEYLNDLVEGQEGVEAGTRVFKLSNAQYEQCLAKMNLQLSAFLMRTRIGILPALMKR